MKTTNNLSHSLDDTARDRRHASCEGLNGGHEAGRAVSRFFRSAVVTLAFLLGCGQAFADQFYFTRVRALADSAEGATGLFLWNDGTGAQSQIGGTGAVYLRHATDGPMAVGGIATNSAGILYGFALDDMSNPTFLPLGTSIGSWNCPNTMRSRLVIIDPSTAVITYVGPYQPSRALITAAFDGMDRLWAYDCVANEMVEIDPATGDIIGTPIATGITVTVAGGMDFAANGLGIIGYNELQFRVFDPDAGWVANVPTSAQNSGFDGGLPNPYAIVGVAFTNHLAARNGSPAAGDCRLNLQEHRGLDELGHANDPFFANPVIAFREAEELNPGTVAPGWFNGGPGDMTRAGGPALPDCFFDWGDAPASYATLRANNGARHAVAGPSLGSALPDFEVDGQPGPATGDNNIGTDDETGVATPTLTRGATVAIEITVGGETAATRLQGWIDWDGDGSFSQPADQVIIDGTVIAGLNTFNVNVPITAVVGTTYARFRIADQAGLGFDGPADSGEVEDHAVLITAGQPLLTKTFAVASIPYGGSAALTFTIDNTAAGAIDQTGMAFTDNLPVGLMIATPANVASTCAGATVTANAGTSTIIVSGASALAGESCTIAVDVTNRPGYTGICYDPNFANENQNITGLNNLAAAIAQFTCLSVEPPDCPSADYTNGFDNVGGLSPNLNNGVSGQCLALLPTITLNKISEAGTGSFDFTFGNTDATNPVTIVTTAPSLPAAAGPFNVLDMAQPVTIAETGLPAGWVLSSIACITEGGDAIGSFDAGTATWTVAPDELASGQQITCTALNLAPAAVGTVKALSAENGSEPGIAEPGEQLTYTITLTNTGGVDAVNYPITDVLDPNVTFVSADNGGTLVGSNVEWTGLTVPAGGSLVLTVVVDVVDPIPVGVTSIGNVAYDPTDPPPPGYCDQVPTPPNCTITPTEPNVSDSKVLTGESGSESGVAEPGEQLTYTITLTNSGGIDATNESRIDQLDPNVVFVSADNGGVLVGSQVQWTGLTVPAGGNLVLTVVVQVVDPIPDGVTSIGNVVYDPIDPPPPGYCDQVPTPPNCTVTPTPPQLRVEKSIIAESLLLDGIAEPGEELTYSVRVRNTGGTDALNRIVNEIVPANTVYVATGSDAWSCVDGSGPGTPCNFTVATVPANSFVDLLFRVRIDDPIPQGVTQIANSVALDGEIPPVCPPAAGDPQDPACVVIPTVPQTVVAKALTAESLGQNGQAEANEVLTYTITVTNHGGSDDTNVPVNEIVPDYTTTAAGNQAVNGALGNWTCADGAGPGTACDLTLALVPSGGSVTLQFMVRIDDPIPDGVTQIANSVALGGNPPPPCPPAGGQCVITPTEPSVSVVKTLLLEDGTQTGVAEAGETLVYQLQVTNSGGSVALAEFLREIVPEHATFVADPVSSPGWTCADGSPNPIVCDLVFDIGPLQTLNFLFAVEVVDPIPDGVTQIANSIGLGGNPPPCPPGGVHCVVTPTANLDTGKTIVSVTPVGANGYRVTYQIVVTNTGGAPGAYTLVDELAYPAAGVTLLSPAIASTADGMLEPGLIASGGQFTPVNNTPIQLSDIDVPLAPGASHTYTVAVPIAVDPAQVGNGACTGEPGNGLYNSVMVVGTDEDDADACAPVPADAPRLDLVKRNRLLDTNGNGYGDIGEALEYTFEIANSGNAALSSLRLLDAKIRPPQGAWVACDRPGTPGNGSFIFAAPLEAGGAITCTATYNLSATDVSVRRVTNTATTIGIAPDGRQVRVSATSIFENFQ